MSNFPDNAPAHLTDPKAEQEWHARWENKAERRRLLRHAAYYRAKGKTAQVKGCQRDMARLRSGDYRPIPPRGGYWENGNHGAW